jgi:hypothetical protein
VSLDRVRLGEAIAGAGALGLLVLLFLDWFALESTLRFALENVAPGAVNSSGWTSLGWLLVVLLVGAMLCATALVLLTIAARPVAQPVAAAVLTIVVGGLAALVLVLRVVTEPGLGVGAPNGFVDVKPAAWLGVLCAVAIPTGAWVAIADERTDAAESAHTPPPPRPAPPVAAPWDP